MKKVREWLNKSVLVPRVLAILGAVVVLAMLVRVVGDLIADPRDRSVWVALVSGFVVALLTGGRVKKEEQ